MTAAADDYDGMAPAELIRSLAALNAGLGRLGVPLLMTAAEARLAHLTQAALVDLVRDTAAELITKAHQLRGLSR